MAVKNLAATLSSDFLAAISPSRTARSSSGSVPSMPICRPRLRNGSSMSLTWASSASRPSLRAFSARLTSVWMRSAIGGTFSGSSPCLNQASIFATSFIPEPAMAAPKVPPNRRLSGGSRTIAIGLEPSMIIVIRRAAIARAMPIRVAGSMGSALLSARERHDRGGALVVVRERGPVLAAVHLVGGGEDAGPVLPDLLQHLVDALLDDVLGAVDEEGDRVGVAFHPLDQVGVEREPLSVQAGHTDHDSVLTWGRSWGGWSSVGGETFALTTSAPTWGVFNPKPPRGAAPHPAGGARPRGPRLTVSVFPGLPESFGA